MALTGETKGATFPMTEHAITLNSGSSSIKFAVYVLSEGADPELRASGQVERIGEDPVLEARFPNGEVVKRGVGGAGTHEGACTAILEEIEAHLPSMIVPVVGHRIVHGGPDFTEPVVLDETTLRALEQLSPFAPLHQPHNLAGVAGAKEAFPNALQTACFDTAFHRSHPWVNDTFALPRRFYEQGVRRYGFHGVSYDYIADRLQQIAPTLYSGRVIVAHLGNGASMCGLLGGRSMASTMGFSAVDGLPMGTRCGQLDPGVVLYLMDQEGMSADEISDLLYKQSGLLGLSGLSNDMRTLQAARTPEANQAIDYYVFRIRRELGALSAVLGGLDALVFTGGIGENSHLIRERVCEGQAWLGIEIDRALNEDNATVISTAYSRTRVMVVPTNEELVIARAADRLLQRHRS